MQADILERIKLNAARVITRVAKYPSRVGAASKRVAQSMAAGQSMVVSREQQLKAVICYHVLHYILCKTCCIAQKVMLASAACF